MDIIRKKIGTGSKKEQSRFRIRFFEDMRLEKTPLKRKMAETRRVFAIF